jgi:TPP-dependent pyruvate/acetoin dehydrogenase alpha subunit
MIGSLNPLQAVIEALQNQQAMGQAQIQAHNEAIFAEFMDAVDTAEAANAPTGEWPTTSQIS